MAEDSLDLIAVQGDEVLHDRHGVLGRPLRNVLGVENRDAVVDGGHKAVVALDLRVMAGLTADLDHLDAVGERRHHGLRSDLAKEEIVGAAHEIAVLLGLIRQIGGIQANDNAGFLGFLQCGDQRGRVGGVQADSSVALRDAGGDSGNAILRVVILVEQSDLKAVLGRVLLELRPRIRLRGVGQGLGNEADLDLAGGCFGLAIVGGGRVSLGRVGLCGTGNHRQHHDEDQQQSDEFLHFVFLQNCFY